MSPSVFFHRFFLSLFLAIAGLSSALAQTVTLNNAACPSATVTFGAGTIAINTAGCTVVTGTAPAITSGALSVASVGVAYSHTFAASGTTPITWSVSVGTLPAGLTLNSSSGLLSGTPTTAGSVSFTVQAANGTAPNATQAVTMQIDPPSGPPVITSAAPTAGAIGLSYSHNFSASGAQPISWAITSGTLPLWAGFNTSGLITGTPTAASSTPLTITATNSVSSATQSFTLVVTAPTPPTITGATPPAGTANSVYTSYTFTATGSAPIAWTVASGTPPTGLSLSTAGVLSGTPTTAGTYTFTVQAANGALPNAVSATLTVTIGATGTAFTKDTSGADIPVPSKVAGTRPTTHTGTNGAGALYAWAANPTRCDNTQPAISSSWHHNIDFYQHGVQGQLDNFDMAPNESLTYEFIPTETGPGQVFLGTNGQLPLPANFLSISTKPCDFDVTKLVSGPTRDFCYVTAPVDNQLSWIVTTGAAYFTCKMVPGTKYYLNLRWQDASPGGANTVDSCAARGLARCGAYLQIRR